MCFIRVEVECQEQAPGDLKLYELLTNTQNPLYSLLVNQANFLLGYEVINMIIVLVTTKEKS